ncbi:hypothetical protein LXL04_017443 [Taraxacum kok-saghyz]
MYSCIHNMCKFVLISWTCQIVNYRATLRKDSKCSFNILSTFSSRVLSFSIFFLEIFMSNIISFSLAFSLSFIMVNEQDPDSIQYDVKRTDFPDNFMFGVGTSAYQVEGGWNVDGKGLSNWDTFILRHGDKISGGGNGCVAVDNYARWKEDVQLLKKMGVNYYRFSIPWTRILPGGKLSRGKSLKGINHYNKLIDELLDNGIKPFVTLFHWDLPNALEEEYMGFLSSKVVDDFVDFADICFWEFGDRVKDWVTLNEPYRFTFSSYIRGQAPPGRGGKGDEGDPETEPYIVAYNLLNCHAAAYKKYEKDYKAHQKGKVGITLDTDYFKPYGGPNCVEDVKAVQYAYDFMFGWFLEPLTKGTWPESMQKFATSPTSKYPKGRPLPKFSHYQLEKLIGSYDFLGINYYTANYARFQAPSSDVALGFLTDCHYTQSGYDPERNPIGPVAFEGSWVYLCPDELTELLSMVKDTYNVKKSIVITENGSQDQNFPEKTFVQVRNDTFRLNYLKKHLVAIKNARRKGVNVMGHFVWSFMDSFEWWVGYNSRFGMFYVDYANNLQRYPKNSAIWYRKFLSEKERIPIKRSLPNREHEQDDEVNDTMIDEEEEIIEVIPKLKKAKA